MKFLLDANFLMIPGKYKVDIFTELERFGKPELFTLDTIISEISKISLSPGSDSRYAKLALSIIEQKGIVPLPTEGLDTDQEIVRMASEKGFTVCTQDKILKNTLQEKKIPVITLRQKKYLVYENSTS